MYQVVKSNLIAFKFFSLKNIVSRKKKMLMIKAFFVRNLMFSFSVFFLPKWLSCYFYQPQMVLSSGFKWKLQFLFSLHVVIVVVFRKRQTLISLMMLKLQRSLIQMHKMHNNWTNNGTKPWRRQKLIMGKWRLLPKNLNILILQTFVEKVSKFISILFWRLAFFWLRYWHKDNSNYWFLKYLILLI
jgi:hypothetical protein